MTKLRKRIEAWLASANCNCDDGVYCTYCEILSDVIEYMDDAESKGYNGQQEDTQNVDRNSGVAEGDQGRVDGAVEADPAASAREHEACEGSDEAGGQVDEELHPSCGVDGCDCCDDGVCGPCGDLGIGREADPA